MKRVECRDARIKAMVLSTEYSNESCERGPNVSKTVEETKKTMRHFYRNICHQRDIARGKKKHTNLVLASIKPVPEMDYCTRNSV
jgi:hypothetical protein